MGSIERPVFPDSSWHLSVFGEMGYFRSVWREHLPVVLMIPVGVMYGGLPMFITSLLLKFLILIILMLKYIVGCVLHPGTGTSARLEVTTTTKPQQVE